MRIVHILDHSLPMASGYSYRSHAILAAQKARGASVVAVTGQRHHQQGPNPEWQDGLCYHRSQKRQFHWPALSELLEVLILARQIVRVSRRFRPALLHAHSPLLNGLAGLLAARWLGVPLVYEVRAFWEDAAVENGKGQKASARYRLIRIAEAWLAKQAEAVVAICAGIAADLVARGVPSSKISCIPNGTNASLPASSMQKREIMARQLGLQGREVIGFIGSFYPYEGLEDLIAVFPDILAERPCASLLLVGGGPAEARLRAQAQQSNAAAHIHFAGRVAHAEVGGFYGLIDILVYPRRQSRLTNLVTPLKPLEAMAHRGLVLASDIGGHRELVQDGETGHLFPPDDRAAMAQAIIRLLQNLPAQAVIRKTAFNWVVAERHWSHLVTRYDSIYHQITNTRRSKA